MALDFVDAEDADHDTEEDEGGAAGGFVIAMMMVVEVLVRMVTMTIDAHDGTSLIIRDGVLGAAEDAKPSWTTQRCAPRRSAALPQADVFQE